MGTVVRRFRHVAQRADADLTILGRLALELANARVVPVAA